ncbi:hypothetical protein PENARI_c086G08514 [Penicillium arizonense]|uniref:BHLH domain-containing protein n=1 Tax=Penicillium arizonense TaxID=1835702 RepID=A0A1F5L159_PENAI|nr:hypothetical protein PENARI_c086G08514 [Penicillium arizonense]OGE46934.1 hypothetical protein PENARI_c086G08514 [Penicillium arizonense]
MFHIGGSACFPFPGRKDSHNALPAATGYASKPANKIIILVNYNLSKSWDNYSGEPTIEAGAKKIHVNQTNISFRKSTGSISSNICNGVNGQSRPKQQLNRACNRLSKGLKSTPSLPPQQRLNPSSPEFQFVEERSCAMVTSHAAAIGFIPTVTTTISGGGPKPQLPLSDTTRHQTGGLRAPLQQQHQHQNTRDPTADMMTLDQPMSRSSSTDNTATEGASQTHRARDTLKFDAQSTAESCHMSRTRRIPDGTKMPVRKPLPSKQRRSKQLAGLSAEPIGQQATANRIALLDAKKGDLRRRRVNLETVIYELTQVIQPDVISYDAAVKAEVKKAVLSIEKEIAEIRWKEHEIGFKVARAWQRADESENSVDSSWLWAKRVAG